MYKKLRTNSCFLRKLQINFLSAKVRCLTRCDDYVNAYPKIVIRKSIGRRSQKNWTTAPYNTRDGWQRFGCLCQSRPNRALVVSLWVYVHRNPVRSP